MDDLLDSFDELSGRERSRRAGYRFPDNSSHPLSSYSQRGPNLAGLQSTHDLERSKILYESAQARTQQLAQIRDAQAGLYEAEQRNRILEHSNAAFDMLKSADPNDPSFERIALDINKNHARAFQDPAFKQAFDFANGIYTRGVKADQDAKKTAGAQQNMLDRQGFAEQERAVRGLSPEYAQMYDQRLAELGPDASDLNLRRAVLNEVRRKAADTDKYVKLEEAGVPWEGRRAGERGVDQLIDPNTGMLDTAKADSWLRDAQVTKDKISAAGKFLDKVEDMRKDSINGPALLEANADKIREATELLASGFSSGFRKPVEDRAWAAVAGPTRELERLNQQVKAEPDERKKAAIYNQMRPLVAQRDEAAKAHPGFNLSQTPEDGETPAQAENRVRDNMAILSQWPTGTKENPIYVTINGVKKPWDENLLAAARAGGAIKTDSAATQGEPKAAGAQPGEAPAANPVPVRQGAASQQQTEAGLEAAAIERLKMADPGTSARLEAELAQVPRTGFWAGLYKNVEGGQGSKAQEAMWGLFEDKAKNEHRAARLAKAKELWDAERKQYPNGELPPEKQAAYDNAALDIWADYPPDQKDAAGLFITSPDEEKKLKRNRDLGLALRKARQEQLTADRKK